MTQQLQQIIDAAWEDRAKLSPASAPPEVLDAVEQVISQLNKGVLRVATRESVGVWTTHQWIKKAVLLSFRLKDNVLMRAGDLGFFDKVQTKFSNMDMLIRALTPLLLSMYSLFLASKMICSKRSNAKSGT